MSVAPDAPEEVRHSIDAGNARWAEAWAKGDASILASLFADDGVQLAGNGKTFKGPREIREHMAAILKATGPGVKVTVTTARVWLDGDTAYESGYYKYEFTTGDKPEEGRYVTIWKRQQGGAWKIAMDMGVPQ